MHCVRAPSWGPGKGIHMKFMNWAMVLSFSLGMAAQSVPAFSQDQQEEPLRDLTLQVIGMLQAQIEKLGLLVDQAVTDDENGVELKVTPKQTYEMPPEAAFTSPLGQILQTSKLFRVAYLKKDKKVVLQGDFVKDWNSIKIKDLKDAKKNDLISVGITSQFRYTIQLNGSVISLTADSPRKDNAIRLHPHSRVGNLWMREAQINMDDLSGRANIGIAGNAFGIITKFQLSSEKPTDGTLPITFKIDINKTLNENLALILLGPFLLIAL